VGAEEFDAAVRGVHLFEMLPATSMALASNRT
jgi:hypothetical protein